MSEVRKYTEMARSVAVVDPGSIKVERVKVPQALFDRVNSLQS